MKASKEEISALARKIHKSSKYRMEDERDVYVETIKASEVTQNRISKFMENYNAMDEELRIEHIGTITEQSLLETIVDNSRNNWERPQLKSVEVIKDEIILLLRESNSFEEIINKLDPFEK